MYNSLITLTQTTLKFFYAQERLKPLRRFHTGVIKFRHTRRDHPLPPYIHSTYSSIWMA